MILKKPKPERKVVIKKQPKEQKVVLKSYHITADVTCEIKYIKSTKKGKTYEVSPSETKYKPSINNNHTFEDVNEEVFATSEAEAIEKYEQCVESSFSGVVSGHVSPDAKVVKIGSISNMNIIDMSTGARTHPADILMKKSSHVSYNFIPADESLLKNNEELDMCVPSH